MYCAETSEEAEEGWTYFRNQLRAAQRHYFDLGPGRSDFYWVTTVHPLCVGAVVESDIVPGLLHGEVSQ